MSVAERPRRRRVSLGSALLRRGWILLLCAIAVGALGYAVAGLQSATYTAHATLAVNPALGPANPGNASQASQLASTYAQALPDDQNLERIVRREVSSQAQVRDNIRAFSSQSSSVVRVSFVARRRGDALKGARAIANALASPKQVTSSVTPGTLQVVRRPTVATSFASAAGPRYRARVVLVVPSGGGSTGTVSVDQATKLAVNYAALIPADNALRAAVAKKLDVGAGDVQSALSVVNEANTALLDVAYQTDSPSKANAGARAATAALVGPTPASSAILPSSLQVVSVPHGAGPPTKQDKTPAIVVGALIGLALGFVLLIAWERSDPHIRSPRDLSAIIGCPATPVDQLSSEAAHALLERWAVLTPNRPARIAVLPADAGMEAVTDAVIARLVDAGGRAVRVADDRSNGHAHDDGPTDGTFVNGDTNVVLVRAGAMGGPRAGQAVALGCDLTVVVVPIGIKAADVHSLADDFADFGIVPVWALLSPRRAARVPQPQTASTVSG
jgi:capsular polysaccharide biosynthesis protein